MKYNFCEIGERIRRMRKNKFSNQDAFIEELREKYKVPIGRNKVSAIENGEQGQFTLPFLLACCDIFDCDMGYLLGEYGDCKTRDNQFIHDTTGLSELSIERLIRNGCDPQNDFIEFLLSSNSYYKIDREFSSFQNHIKWCNSCIKGVQQCEKQAESMDVNSAEYADLEKQWREWIHSAERWGSTQEANIYQMGIMFGNMLNQYKSERAIVYGTYRED